MSPTMGMYSGTSLREVIEARPRKEGTRKMPLAGLLDGVSPVKGLWVTQDMLEPVLVDVAREREGVVSFRTECLGLEQDDSGVTATLKDRETGGFETMRADYLIAAGGAGSPIRNGLGTPTTGRGTMGYLLNILFTADLKSLVQGREFSLCKIVRPELYGLFTSINNSDRWVFHLSYDPASGEKAVDYTPEKCKELLRIAVGMPEIEIEIKSILPWDPSVKIAEQLKHGRMFLAGDAAHQMPPWAGQGATSGIADMYNLAWKLASVLKGQASEALLETYDAERIPVGRVAAEASENAADEKGIIDTDKSFKNMVSLLGRAHIMSGHRYCYTSKAICAEDTSPLGGLTWRPWTLPSLGLSIDGRPGSRVPHIWATYQGKCVSTLDLRGNGYVLLAGAGAAAWVNAAERVSSEIGIGIKAYCAGPEGNLVSTRGEFEAAAGISAQGAILVRPDDFVVWRQRRGSSSMEASIRYAMKHSLCIQ